LHENFSMPACRNSSPKHQPDCQQSMQKDQSSGKSPVLRLISTRLATDSRACNSRTRPNDHDIPYYVDDGGQDELLLP
jgi:hypothetical protein